MSKTRDDQPSLASRLERMARDLWWTWQPEGAQFWASLDPAIWREVSHRPIALLQRLGAAGPSRLRGPTLHLFEQLEAERAAYLSSDQTWHDLAGKPLERVAYFSAEYGIHESFPIYSGGLGILSGDHVKSASDLGLPFVAVGLLYRNGYVRQSVDPEGHQIAKYYQYDFATYAATPVQIDGAPLRVTVEVLGAPCSVQVWRQQVGRVTLYLLDTDVPENPENLRGITAELYGGGVETRIKQELVLGVGGLRALRAIGFHPTVFHLNEGHSSFLSLERIRERVAAGEGVDSAIAEIRSNAVFTTHTPVEAGHDRFSVDLIWSHLRWFAEAVGMARLDLLRLGWWPDEQDHSAVFNMTLLAMKTCGRLNGVAALHGEVSRQMFARYWRELPLEEVPITHVTNGVHAPSWQAHTLHAVLSEYMPPGYRDRPPSDPIWAGIDAVPDSAIWAVHTERKQALLALVRARQGNRVERLGLESNPDLLSVDALTIGFARRFAPYKRADLLFSQMDRLLGILDRAPGPVQFLFAGKAHPADEKGKRLVQRVFQASQHPALRGRVMLIEDYDIEVGRTLVQGVDVWLNNPRRPKEASGTSGMKVSMNGGLNLSILDGWWPEGFNGSNGWAIGEEIDYPTVEAHDLADADSLYHLLEHQVIPTYYDRLPNQPPQKWCAMMKSAIRSVTPAFHSDRQVIDYVHHLYAPS